MSSRSFLVRFLWHYFAGFDFIFYSLAVVLNGVYSYTYIVVPRPQRYYVFAQTVVTQTGNRQIVSVLQ